MPAQRMTELNLCVFYLTPSFILAPHVTLGNNAAIVDA